MEKDATLKEKNGTTIKTKICVNHISRINSKRAGAAKMLGKVTSQEPMRKLQTVLGTTPMKVQIAKSGRADGEDPETMEDRRKDLVDHDLGRGHHLRKRR